MLIGLLQVQLVQGVPEHKSQLLFLQLEIEAVALPQLQVLPGERKVDVGRRDLLTLHRVHSLHHLEADLVDEVLRI